MKLNEKEKKLLTKEKTYKPIASELARKARWAGSPIYKDRTKYTRKRKHKGGNLQ